MLHGDIHPENILVSDSGVMIIDFSHSTTKKPWIKNTRSFGFSGFEQESGQTALSTWRDGHDDPPIVWCFEFRITSIASKNCNKKDGSIMKRHL
ncbi:hypothetical protein PILCRDRAFT_726146 [Piloderma croceum F 1598]|uniref:Protein kinase domain-containing protein n=1 Tax=Piloderma croceum (strain F 1598) TaxID=765440 RepID=A0A0C3F0I8_PILCF|nr:hypothetical protein PILCRDRAFT_726146 [Piloderma croceum F 1598]